MQLRVIKKKKVLIDKKPGFVIRLLDVEEIRRKIVQWLLNLRNEYLARLWSIS